MWNDERSPAEHVSRLDRFTRLYLPGLNTGLEAGTVTWADWRGVVGAELDGTDQTASALSEATAYELLFPLLGIIGCSAEHHAQIAGDKPGTILGAFPGLLPAMRIAGRQSGHVWMTAYEFWPGNKAPTLSFTAAGHHRTFHDAVGVQVQAHRGLNDLLADVADGQYEFGTSAAKIMVSTAAVMMEKTQQQYHTLTHGITPEQFREFRNWLVSTRIDGQVVKGPNAAWLYPMPRTDLLLGTADTIYVAETRAVMSYYSPGDAALFATDVGRRTVYDAAADALGLIDAETLARTPDAEVFEAVAGIDVATRGTLDALTTVWKHLVGASSAHYGQIVRCLLRGHYTDEELARMPVPPTEGTGGNGIEQVRRILTMRKEYAPAKKISAALKAVA